MKRMIEDNRSLLSVSEAGDRIAAGENLIMGGTRLKDGLMIKAGINLLKTVGWPFYFIITNARYLVKEATKK